MKINDKKEKCKEIISRIQVGSNVVLKPLFGTSNKLFFEVLEIDEIDNFILVNFEPEEEWISVDDILNGIGWELIECYDPKIQ